MSTGTLALIGLVVVLLVIGLFVMGVYNGLVGLRNRYENAFAQIDVQLKRRYDLIPNLVAAAKGYMEHEKSALEAVIAARNQAVSARANAASHIGSAGEMQALAGAESALSGALTRFFAVSEAYPDLKAQANISDLMEELKSTENKVSFARQHYNDSVTSYNTDRERFPAVLFAASLGFKEAELLEAVTAPEQREAPKVQF